MPRGTSRISCLMVLVAAACGGSGSPGDPPPPPPPPPTVATGTIGPGGGAVELARGVRVEVPAGVLASVVTISITRTAVIRGGALTPVFQFEPQGMTFSSPVSVTFAIPAGTRAASVYWTSAGGTGQYESLPTDVAGATATARVTHFSAGFVGALHVAGTWTGTVAYTIADPLGGLVSSGRYYHARDVTQDGDAISYDAVTSTGWSGRCTGTIAGTSIISSLSDTCVVTSLNGACSLSIERSETVDNTVSPMRLTTDWGGTFSGAGCPQAGDRLTATSSLTYQSSPTLDVSGTWAGSFTQTVTNASGGTSTTSGTLTRVRTQLGSRVSSQATSDSGAAHRCLGPLIGNTLHSYCEGSKGGCTFRTSYSAVVFADASPMTGAMSFGWIYDATCAPSATSVGTGTETRL